MGTTATATGTGTGTGKGTRTGKGTGTAGFIARTIKSAGHVAGGGCQVIGGKVG